MTFPESTADAPQEAGDRAREHSGRARSVASPDAGERKTGTPRRRRVTDLTVRCLTFDGQETTFTLAEMAASAGLDASPVTRHLLNSVLDDLAALCCFLHSSGSDGPGSAGR